MIEKIKEFAKALTSHVVPFAKTAWSFLLTLSVKVWSRSKETYQKAKPYVTEIAIRLRHWFVGLSRQQQIAVVSAPAICCFVLCIVLGSSASRDTVYAEIKTEQVTEESQDDVAGEAVESLHLSESASFITPDHESPVLPENIKVLLAKAERGDVDSQFTLGEIYANGDGVPRSVVDARRWLRAAMAQGSSSAASLLQLLDDFEPILSKEVSPGIRLLLASASNGDMGSQFDLGLAYMRGDGVSKDYAEAVKWYRMVADQGCEFAQHNLGACYLRGEGVRRDLVESARWFRKSAEQGNADAQFTLGIFYINGFGVSQDGLVGAQWINRAAKQGHQEAIEAVERIRDSFVNQD